MSDESTNASDANDNLEWELSDLVDAIAAEIDAAQDTLSLKSYSRGLSLAIKKLNLTIEVKARRTGNGRFLFRTLSSNETSGTVLKLEFDQVLQSQLTDVRKSFEDKNGASISVSSTDADDSFSQLSADQRRALEILGIRSLDDLQRYPKTPQIMAEISRKTGIAVSQIQEWCD